MTAQSTFMITAFIDDYRLDELKQLLSTMNQFPGFANPRNEIIPYWQLHQLHVARFTILEARTNSDIKQYGIEPSHWQPALCFMGDIDGHTDLFLAELVIRAEAGLKKVFSCCKDFDSNANLLQWLHSHNHPPAAAYVNWRGRTVRQIREEQALANALRLKARALSAEHPSIQPVELYYLLKSFSAGEVAARRMALSDPEPAPISWHLGNIAHLLSIPLILLLLTPIFILVSPLYFYFLRQREEIDPENTLPPDTDHLASLTVQEDIDVTNHFNVFGQVKPGLLRLFTIKFGLLLLDYTSRHIYNRGYLTRVQTIHFARWVLMDNNKRVFFASNYDGSADSYMDDFINKVAWGLNLVFSNGVGYPKTRWLLKGGAQQEEKYKRTLRRNQLPSQSWYKAYPGLTAFDLARNTHIRKGLETAHTSDREIRQWLSLL